MSDVGDLEAKVNFSMFLGGTGHRQATVLAVRGTGILGPYTTTYFSDSSKISPEI